MHDTQDGEEDMIAGVVVGWEDVEDGGENGQSEAGAVDG